MATLGYKAKGRIHAKALQRWRDRQRINAALIVGPTAASNAPPIVNKPSRPKTEPALEKEWCIMVSDYFRHTSGMPPEKDWVGVAGTIANIMKVFN
jgi:hypothetical protein